MSPIPPSPPEVEPVSFAMSATRASAVSMNVAIAQGSQCCHRKEIRFADDHQGRRHCCERVELQNSLENLGAQIVREVASKSNDVAGDGITATVLAQAIYREGVKTVAAGANPMVMKRGIEKC